MCQALGLAHCSLIFSFSPHNILTTISQMRTLMFSEIIKVTQLGLEKQQEENVGLMEA